MCWVLAGKPSTTGLWEAELLGVRVLHCKEWVKVNRMQRPFPSTCLLMFLSHFGSTNPLGGRLDDAILLCSEYFFLKEYPIISWMLNLSLFFLSMSVVIIYMLVSLSSFVSPFSFFPFIFMSIFHVNCFLLCVELFVYSYLTTKQYWLFNRKSKTFQPMGCFTGGHATRYV